MKIAGPSQNQNRYDNHGLEKSLLLKKFKGGKMERAIMTRSDGIDATQAKRPGSFTVEEVMQAFGPEFLDEERCRAWVLKQLHGDTPICPGCGIRITTSARFWDGEQVRCDACGRKFTALTGTFLSGMQFDLREVLLLAVLLWFNTSNHMIANILKVDQETVRLWRHRFQKCKGDTR